MLFPLVFCRVCGQEHYLCAFDQRDERITPRLPLAREDDDHAGYLLIDPDEFWPDDYLDLLPETWFNERKRGRTLKPNYRRFQPRRVQPRDRLDSFMLTKEDIGAY